MTRRPDTGHGAMMALLLHDDVLRAQATEALRRHLRAHGGNATRTARELGLSGAQPLMALVGLLGLRGWLEKERKKKDQREP